VVHFCRGAGTHTSSTLSAHSCTGSCTVNAFSTVLHSWRGTVLHSSWFTVVHSCLWKKNGISEQFRIGRPACLKTDSYWWGDLLSIYLLVGNLLNSFLSVGGLFKADSYRWGDRLVKVIFYWSAICLTVSYWSTTSMSLYLGTLLQTGTVKGSHCSRNSKSKNWTGTSVQTSLGMSKQCSFGTSTQA
jgi:hypothetical protein